MDKNKERNLAAEGTSVLRGGSALSKRLIKTVANVTTRSALFQVLATDLEKIFDFDRLCINLYDSEREVLSLFTGATGAVVSALSNTRLSHGTVAGIALSTRRPVIISNILEYFSAREEHISPLAEAGLNATIAIPLIVRQEVLGTLHCSFAQAPPDMVNIFNFMVDLSPTLALCLFTVLASERLENMAPTRALVHSQGDPDPALLLDTPGMKEVMALVNRVSALDIPVLLTGETGTGKSYMAAYIHQSSPRRQANFIKVNCPSLAPGLFESEIFGHAKGSFTGANSKRIGRMELAQGGTLFLDEIAELNQDMQSKLLQALEENAFERVGESIPLNVDVRLISATNVDIREALFQKRLRRDLYYRLASLVIRMPPLRERREDIPLFINYFTHQQAMLFAIKPPALPSKIVDELSAYNWPGNIREMRNVITRILIQSMEAKMSLPMVQDILYGSPESFPANKAPGSSLLTHAPKHLSIRELSEFPPESPRENPPEATTLEDVERAHILATLQRCKGRISGPKGAAALLNVPRTTLQYRMRKLGIQPD